MSRLCASVLMLGLLAVPAASAQESPPQARGLVFVVGGVGGSDFIAVSAGYALPRAGINHEVRQFVWTHGKGRLLRDLQDTRHLLAKADELAAEVRRVKEEAPRRPVYLIGHSGGAGLVLAAAERLPPATLERVVLLSAAVSPGYDLRAALRATKGEIVSFNSPIDLFWLGWGTTTFGTVDRCYVCAAGLNGFAVPDNLNDEGRALYGRLVQVAWKPELVWEHFGGLHVSTTMPDFLARHVATWLGTTEPGTHE